MRPVFCFEIMTAPQFLDMAPRLHIVPEFAVPTPLLAAWVGGCPRRWESFMKPTRKLSRRSFLGRVAGGAIAGGAALTIMGGEAQAQGCSDSDSGPNGDPSGRGRRCGSTGCSDSDTGQYADGVGRGRRCGSTPAGCS